MTKGGCAALSLGGAAINVNRNANQVYGGAPVTAARPITNNASGPRVKPLLAEIERVIRSAKK